MEKIENFSLSLKVTKINTSRNLYGGCGMMFSNIKEVNSPQREMIL
jgi:hypothetical protein